MAVTSPEDFNAFRLKWYYSSHAIGIETSLGGAKTTVEISQLELHNLFTKVTDDQADLGKTTFKCIYVYNSHPREPIRNPIITIPANSSSSDDQLAAGWGLAPINGTEQTIATESTPPNLITFKESPTRTEGSVLGRSIPPLSSKSIWIRRVVNFNAQEYPGNGAVLRLLTDNVVQEIIDDDQFPVPDDDYSWTEHGEHDTNDHYSRICDRIRHRNSNMNCSTGNWTRSDSESGGATAKAGNAIRICGSNLIRVTRMAFGRDDCDNPAQENHYRNTWGLRNRHHSWQEQNVHYCFMDTANGKKYWDETSKQYEFIVKDLAAAHADAATDWIVVFTNRCMYSSPTTTSAKYILKDLRDLYHPIFERNGVHFVIQGHLCNYQRSGVLHHNAADSDNPTLIDQGLDPNYTIGLGKQSFDDGADNSGCIFITNGAGGRGHDNISSLAAFTKYSNAVNYGYVYARHRNEADFRKITLTFYDEYDKFLDKVTVTKQIT